MKTFKFRWILAVTFIVWVCAVGYYEAGLSHWPEFAFVHTLIVPVVLLVTLTPCSVKRLVSTRLFRPCLAGWAGIMIPVSYFVVRWLTGFGSHCDRPFIVGGAIASLIILARWGVERFNRSLDRAVERSAEAFRASCR